ncbi:AraC family transcriptional regulator [Vineibacter terrae]|uniref:AraC family transcriptional regulator n=1 Tax=Vineibacter terrae TaxID=2586908 RepID=A0A5C8PRB9_9HYPH|nr:AraC family transcriptional regulator [Vineibacter terrae]
MRQVTTVALDQNFGNMSRFSSHYRRLFGESPSQTIRAARMTFHAAEQD